MYSDMLWFKLEMAYSDYRSRNVTPRVRCFYYCIFKVLITHISNNMLTNVNHGCLSSYFTPKLFLCKTLMWMIIFRNQNKILALEGSFYKWENWGPKGQNHSSEVIQLWWTEQDLHRGFKVEQLIWWFLNCLGALWFLKVC